MTAQYTVGDSGVDLEGTLVKVRDGAEAVQDLTGATLELHLQPPSGDPLVRTATVVDAAAGTWRYTFAVGELSVRGEWQGEVQAESADGSVTETFGRFEFRVRKEIA